MKDFIKLTYQAFFCLAVMLIFSCSDNVQEELGSDARSEEVPSAVIDKLQDVGFLPCDIQRQGENYLAEGDIVITPAALAEMENLVSVPGVAGEEQYRTCNLVNCNGGRIIRVYGSGLSGTLSTGLDWALANYNSINLCLTFQRVYSGLADITIYATSGAGGSAGWPSGGNPYPRVYVSTSLAAYGANVCEHVIGHEIGHCLGMRHTDYFNRSYSCGSGGNEGSGGVCAIHVPGTPTSYDPNSLYNSCFSSGATGELSNYDIAALQYLY
ncbi:M57 family metalloprotease [Roseivirga sp. BDSF3-8]|uniref:M57 family metalloprotease n=1 Tax=Roseivirga sp. BDSF3-8 TaxID=3241598 RepID=UPI003531FB84